VLTLNLNAEIARTTMNLGLGVIKTLHVK